MLSVNDILVERRQKLAAVMGASPTQPSWQSSQHISDFSQLPQAFQQRYNERMARGLNVGSSFADAVRLYNDRYAGGRKQLSTASNNRLAYGSSAHLPSGPPASASSVSASPGVSNVARATPPPSGLPNVAAGGVARQSARLRPTAAAPQPAGPKLSPQLGFRNPTTGASQPVVPGAGLMPSNPAHFNQSMNRYPQLGRR